MRTRAWYIGGAVLAAVVAIGWLGTAIAQPDLTSPADTGFQPPLNANPIIPIPTGQSGQSETQPSTTHSLTMCSLNATDIVVTDTEGRVLETWRGELKPGEIVRLGPMWLTPANALPWEYLRLRPDRTLSAFYHTPEDGIIARRGYIDSGDKGLLGDAICPEVSETVFRLVLFLQKQDMTSFETVWMPAAPQAIIGYRFNGYFRRIFQDADFTTSIAWVEAGQVLMFDRSSMTMTECRWSSNAAQLVPVARSLEDFKNEVMSQPQPLKPSKTWSRHNSQNRAPTPSSLNHLLSEIAPSSPSKQ